MHYERRLGPPQFQAVLNERQTHLVDINDLDFQVGDTLLLREYFSSKFVEPPQYTGREVTVLVTCVSTSPLPSGLCALSIKRWATDQEIAAWLEKWAGGTEVLSKGERVEVVGHRGHVTTKVFYKHTATKNEISAQCSCGTWFGEPKRPRKLPTGKCTTPNGRTDGHGKYVARLGGTLVCDFCKEPVR